MTIPSDVTVDSGLACLAILARFHGIAVDPAQLAHQHGPSFGQFSSTEILLAAQKIGLQARLVRVREDRIARTPFPAMARLKPTAGSPERFVILARVEGDQVLIQCPKAGRPETLSLAAFVEQWSGELILFTSRASLAGEMSKFDFTWFIPAIIKYRVLLGEVLFVSLVLQCFALITPLFFQVVMDKVLVHRGFTTLDVIAVGLVVVVLFEVGLGALRSYPPASG